MICAFYRSGSRNQTWLKSKACFGNTFACHFAAVFVAVTQETCKSTVKGMICFEAMLTV
jgi:hypothetical protein